VNPEICLNAELGETGNNIFQGGMTEKRFAALTLS